MMPAFAASQSWASLFWAAYIAWGLQEVWIFRRDRRRVAGVVEDGGSLVILALSIIAAICAAFWLVRVRAASLAIPPDILVPVAVGTMMLGMALRLWAVRSLGGFFRVTVVAQTGHRLVEDGPYRWLRHPAYTGALLTVIGVALAMGNWLSLFVAPALAVTGFAWRIGIEERSLARQFGGDFDRYRSRRWALLPPIW